MAYSLGLDFGTTFTAAAVERDGVVRVATLGNRSGAVPAAVFLRPDGSLLHGEDAFLRGASEPLRLVRNLKRRLGQSGAVEVDGTRLESVDLVADHLRWAYERVVEREGGPPERLVLTHPASWKVSRLAGFKAAVDKAGLTPELVAEPHAAAMFHAENHPLAVGDLVAAYDLGGGTFDAAVLRRTRQGFDLAGPPEGEDRLGGIDFDDVVFHLVQTSLGDVWRDAKRKGGPAFENAAAALRRECVTAKEALSLDTEVDVPVLLPGVMAPVVVTRRDFEHLIRPAVEESMGSFLRAVTGAGAQVSDLSAVLLVGGSCRLPVVRSSIEQLAGIVPLLDTDPKHAVARGAALMAGESAASGPVAAAPPLPPVNPVAPVEAASPALLVNPVAPVEAASPALAVNPTKPAVVAAPLAVSASAQPGGPQSGSSKKGLLIAGAALLLLLALPLAYFLTRGDDNQPTDQAQETDQQADPAEAAVDTTAQEAGEPADEGTAGVEPVAAEVEASAADMALVPAGDYTLGVEQPGAESVQSFSAPVEDFYIDLYEVSNSNYLAFIQQFGAPVPLGWDGGTMPEGLEEHPVAGVEYAWAEAYCVALGKRLPTEVEWEVAARGPAGTLYPSGDSPEGLDLDLPGTRPVGSTAANLSGFGVFDTVGSVWEWVSEPYVAIDEGTRVRRGGQYGRVRDGAAMRQAVDPTGQATIVETGLRCAATEVDESIAALQFDVEHERPEADDDPGGPTAAVPVDGTALVNESFESTDSGFADVEQGAWRVGYHAPSWYHLEAAQPNTQIMSLGGYNLADGNVELSIYIDRADTDTGLYRYGLVFRSGGALVEPPPGISGPGRPEVYYAFVVNPRAGTWELLHEDELPQRPKLSGPLPPMRVNDPDNPDVLGAAMDGSIVRLSVNGEEVGVLDTEGFHIDAGNMGLYAEAFDETFLHVHFDLLTVDQS